MKDKKSVTWDQIKKGINPPINRSGDFHKHPNSYKIPRIRCWNCKENHYARDCPHKKGDNIYEATGGDVGKTHTLYVDLEGR